MTTQLSPWVIIFMPFARVRVLTICRVMSWIGCAGVIGHPIHIVHTAQPSGGCIWTQIQCVERKIHCHIQLPTKTFRGWEAFQIWSSMLRKGSTHNSGSVVSYSGKTWKTDSCWRIQLLPMHLYIPVTSWQYACGSPTSSDYHSNILKI